MNVAAGPLPVPDANAARPVPPLSRRPILVVPCDDLDLAVEAHCSGGFRLTAIGPADDPRYALVATEGDGPTVMRLDVDAYERGHRHPYLEVEPDSPLIPAGFAVARPDTPPAPDNGGPPGLVFGGAPGEPSGSAAAAGYDGQGWVIGRAGMRYLDLLPGRWGGRFIASRIHIPIGGPVPDYVHYHHVDFQLIYCHRGWVQVVYQDQGDPFVLRPGDAVLQAPGIRHQVLEASDDLEVVEITSPADHATYLDHELPLPNRADRGCKYGGQDFVHHRSSDASVVVTDRGLSIESLGLEQATGGRYGAAVISAPGDGHHRLRLPLADDADVELLVVLDGAIEIRHDRDDGPVRLDAGRSVTVGGGAAATLTTIDAGSRLLQVVALEA